VTREGVEEEMSTGVEEEEEEEVRVGLGGMFRMVKEERARISSSAAAAREEQHEEEEGWVGRVGREEREREEEVRRLLWSSEGVEYGRRWLGKRASESWETSRKKAVFVAWEGSSVESLEEEVVEGTTGAGGSMTKGGLEDRFEQVRKT